MKNFFSFTIILYFCKCVLTNLREIMTMKQYIFVLVLGLIAPVMLNAQINRVISLEYNENDFDIVEIENRVAL